ncbi:response regulator [Sphingobacterium kitahiroshimense]|uniref:response regulator n=1 Tax=Sphingobacterium kitahiroshimense TaxID=470446 RepID=UPI00320A25CB
MSAHINSLEIIDRLKKAYGFKTDKQLAKHLEIPTNTLSNWKIRNTVNWYQIQTKCPEISWDYLRKGTGSTFINNKVDFNNIRDKETEDSLPFSREEKRQFLRILMSKELQQENGEKINKVSILYVDDEVNNLISFKASFRTKYRIYTALNAEEALSALEDYDIPIIITDHRMPGMTGIELLERVSVIRPDIIRILITGYSDMVGVKDAINVGKIFYYIDKPWNEQEIDEVVTLAYTAYVERKKREELEKINEKIEWMLRQKLLS